MFWGNFEGVRDEKGTNLNACVVINISPWLANVHAAKNHHDINRFISKMQLNKISPRFYKNRGLVITDLAVAFSWR